MLEQPETVPKSLHYLLHTQVEDGEKHTFSMYYPSLTAALPPEILRRLFHTQTDEMKVLTKVQLKKEMNNEHQKEIEEKKRRKQEAKKNRLAFIAEKKRQHKEKHQKSKDADKTSPAAQEDQNLVNIEQIDASTSTSEESPKSSQEEEQDVSRRNAPRELSIRFYPTSQSKSELPSTAGSVADSQFPLTFPDANLWYRTVNVLRFTAGTRLVLFNKNVSVLCSFDQRTFERKNEVVVLVEQVSVNTPILPQIVLFPSIVKRDTMVSF